MTNPRLSDVVPPVLVVGSINTDLVVYLRRHPNTGETVSGGRFAVHPGGKGANCAVAASRAGASVRMYGAVGTDTYGEERRASLRAEGVDVEGVVSLPGVHTGIAQIWVDERGDNRIAVASGANAELKATDLRIGHGVAGAIAVFQNEIPQAVTETVIRRLKSEGCRTVWNVAPACRSRPDPRTIEAADILLVNQGEVRALAGLLGVALPAADRDRGVGVSTAVSLARGLCKAGARCVIVTLGPEGSLLVKEGAGQPHRQPAFPATAVDTVGAGDCYCGVLAASLAQGIDETAAVKRASAAAAIAVTRNGAQTSMPTAAEIDRMLGGA